MTVIFNLQILIVKYFNRIQHFEINVAVYYIKLTKLCKEKCFPADDRLKCFNTRNYERNP